MEREQGRYLREILYRQVYSVSPGYQMDVVLEKKRKSMTINHHFNLSN